MLALVIGGSVASGYLAYAAPGGRVSPSPTFTVEPPATTTSNTAAFSYADSQSGSTFKCSLDGSPFAGCPAGTASFAGLSIGVHLFRVEAVWGSSTSSPTPCTWTITTVVPAAPVIVARPTDPSPDPSPEFTFTDASGPSVLFWCALDVGPTAACTGDTDHDGDKVQGEMHYFLLPPGRHCFSVYATNRVGSPGPTTTWCWTIASRSGPADFSVSGDIVPPFTPGTSQRVDLSITNPNPSPLTIPAGGVTITITTTRAGCSASTNFAVTQGLATAVTVPAHVTRSLSGLGIAPLRWPVVTMIETHTNQDICEGAALTLHYSARAT